MMLLLLERRKCPLLLVVQVGCRLADMVECHQNISC
jgi:hypothetical protein